MIAEKREMRAREICKVLGLTRTDLAKMRRSPKLTTILRKLAELVKQRSSQDREAKS